MVERVNFAILFSLFLSPLPPPYFQIIVGNGRLFKPNLLKTFAVRINSFLHKHRPFKVSRGRRCPTLLNFLRQKPTLVASASTSPTRSRGPRSRSRTRVSGPRNEKERRRAVRTHVQRRSSTTCGNAGAPAGYRFKPCSAIS